MRPSLVSRKMVFCGSAAFCAATGKEACEHERSGCEQTLHCESISLRMTAQRRLNFVLKALGDKLRHEGRDVAAHPGDLAHERGGDGANRPVRRGRKPSGCPAPWWHSWTPSGFRNRSPCRPSGRGRSAWPHAVGRPRSPDRRRSTTPRLAPAASHDRRTDRLNEFGPRLHRQERRLRGMDPDRHHDAVGDAAGLAHDVQMPIGDRGRSCR